MNKWSRRTPPSASISAALLSLSCPLRKYVHRMHITETAFWFSTCTMWGQRIFLQSPLAYTHTHTKKVQLRHQQDIVVLLVIFMLLNIVSHSLCPCYYLLDIVLYAHKTATILHWSVEDKDGQNQFESVPLNLKVKWNVWSLEHTRWPWFKLTAVYDHKTIWETVSESIHLKCGNKPCLLFCAAPLTVEIHLINADLPFTLS